MSSMADATCKGCRDDYKVEDEQIVRLIAKLAPEHCVSDEVYLHRLGECGGCLRLLGGVTCTACGCIMPVVAKLKTRGCPLPGEAKRWGRVDVEVGSSSKLDIEVPYPSR